MATAFKAQAAIPEVSYETVFGGKTDGPAVSIKLPSRNELNGNGTVNQAGSLKLINDPELTALSGPYAHFGVTRGDWVREVDGRRRQIIVNVQVYGDGNKALSMAGRAVVGRLEIVLKHTPFGSFVLVNIHVCDVEANAELQLTSSTRNFTAEDGWESFSTEAMGQVRIAVKNI